MFCDKFPMCKFFAFVFWNVKTVGGVNVNVTVHKCTSTRRQHRTRFIESSTVCAGQWAVVKWERDRIDATFCHIRGARSAGRMSNGIRTACRIYRSTLKYGPGKPEIFENFPEAAAPGQGVCFGRSNRILRMFQRQTDLSSSLASSLLRLLLFLEF